MAETFTQVPPDSTGDKLRMRNQTIGADLVHEQAVFIGDLPTYEVLADAVVPAANKHHIGIFNNIGSAQKIRILGIYMVNLSIAGVTGIVARYELRRSTALSAGTDLTPQKRDSADPALANVLAKTNGTTTDGALLYPFVVLSDENTAAVGNFLLDTQFNNLLRYEPNEKRIVLRPGEGITVKQITSSVVGSFAWKIVFDVEPV